MPEMLDVPHETGTIVPLPTVLMPMAEVDQAELAKCEARIRAGLQTFIDVGEALSTIRDKRLYRAEFGSWEAYCEEKWSMTARRARQFCSAAEVVSNLRNNCSALPATESQARPLSALSAPDQQAAWAEAVATAPGGVVTAKHVQDTVDRRRGVAVAAPLVPVSGTIVPPTAKVVDVGPKADRLRAQAKRAIAEIRELLDTVGTADSAASAELLGALHRVENFQTHLERTEELQAKRNHQ